MAMMIEKFVDRAERDARLAKFDHARLHIHKFTDTLPRGGMVWCLAWSPKKEAYADR